MKGAWIRLNKPKFSSFGKQTPSEKYHMVMLKDIDFPIFTVKYVQRIREDLTNKNFGRKNCVQ